MELNKAESNSLPEWKFVTSCLKEDTLLVRWNGFCPPEQYKYGFLKAIEITVENRLCKWLLDFSEIKVINPENQRWTAEVLIKKINNAKINFIAVVNPACDLAKASIECIYGEFCPQPKYNRKVFSDKQAAEEWLSGY